MEIPPPSVGGMVVRAAGNKRGKQGRRETVSGNGTLLSAALVFPLPHLLARTIPRAQRAESTADWLQGDCGEKEIVVGS